MKRIAKSLVSMLLIAVLFMTNAVAFAAEKGVDPRLSHTENGSFAFAIIDNVGCIGVTYYGYDTFVQAHLNVKVEKRRLLVFWSDYYEWDAWSTDIEGEFYHEFPIEKSGTYRASFTLTVTGTTSTVDTITHEIQDSN